MQTIASAVAKCESHLFSLPSFPTRSLFVLDKTLLDEQLSLWRRELPQVQPFYAVKCNPDREIVRHLARAGVNFDCASQVELELVRDVLAEIGGEHTDINDRVIFANPCKYPDHIKFADQNNVSKMTFDNESELHKIAKHFDHNRSNLLLRLATDDSAARCRFSAKFGVRSVEQAFNLLKLSKKLNLNVGGVSFHCGSDCSSDSVFPRAISNARRLFDLAKDKLGIQLQTLDIGGGFPADTGISAHEQLVAPPSDSIPFTTIAQSIRSALGEYFPPESGVSVIAEPGRFFAANCATLLTCVVSVRYDENVDLEQLIYTDESVYRSFNCLFYDHATVQCFPLASLERQTPVNMEKLVKTRVFGDTCDGLDCLGEFELPPMGLGDYLIWPFMGAYTSAAGSNFNGMPLTPTLYIPSSHPQHHELIALGQQYLNNQHHSPNFQINQDSSHVNNLESTTRLEF